MIWSRCETLATIGEDWRLMLSMIRTRHPFRGVDGEGLTLPDGHHIYTLLTAGTDSIENKEGLSAYECLLFLSSLPPDFEYVGYYFDYDVSMIVRGLPEERVRRLLDREFRTRIPGRSPLPVDVGRFQIDYLPGKEFRVRDTEGHGQWIVVNDVGSFYQCSFLKALDRWDIGTPEERETIRRGKELRSSFTATDAEMVIDYNALEIRLLQELMEKFRLTCEAIGFVPSRWQGPGNLATAMFRQKRMPRTKDIRDLIPEPTWDMAQSAYYGGRFETTAAGPVRGPIYQYDINSAYPWACTQLPCLVHARWIQRTRRPTARYWLTEAGFGHGTSRNRFLCHLPVRMGDGSIRYPRQGRGWYWSSEILAAERAGTTTYCDGIFWELEEPCNCIPFAWVKTLYEMRVALGKSDKGILLKLALNSLYGKTAQSVGSAPYANPVYASLITALTRARLIDAYTQAPDACFMLATDGIFMGQELNLGPAEGLGNWDLTVHDDGMFIIQPGLYFTSGATYPKTRGVPMGKVKEAESDFRAAFDRGRESVSISLTNFVGVRLAMARGAYERAGQWEDVVKEVSFDWSTKRRPYAVINDEYGMRTLPYPGARDLITTPYDRAIGGLVLRDLERLQEKEQPDWADTLTVQGEMV